MPKTPFTRPQFDQWTGAAIAKAKAKNPNSKVADQRFLYLLVTCESGEPDKNGNFVGNCGAGKQKSKGDAVNSAKGATQMFPAAFQAAHRELTGVTLTGDDLIKSWETLNSDPAKAIEYGLAFCRVLERNVMSWNVVKDKNITDPQQIQAIVAAAYHMGEGDAQVNKGTGAKSLVKMACEGGSFDPQKFTELYENQSRMVEGGVASARVRKILGVGGSTNDSVGKGDPRQSNPPVIAPPLGPTVAADYVSLGSITDSAAPWGVAEVLWEGLDETPWWATKCPVGNPKLKQLNPAWFELRMNRTNGESLQGVYSDTPIQIRLNVGLQSLKTSSQHIVDRSPTATGLMLTFWGSQMDTLAGRGTTGAFMNEFGLTDTHSDARNLEASGLVDILASVYGENLEYLTTKQPFRVAAQDAFAELLALFKNNGVIRYLPRDMQVALKAKDTYNASNTSQLSAGVTGPQGNSTSGKAGPSGTQQLGLAGDLHTRGYVALNYKGTTYLGYFKTLNFTADAKTPFRWDFDFTFKVQKSYTPIFRPTT